MAEPTYEELLDRIRNLERLVTTEPQMDLGPEYSFPTKDTGISQEQHQQMEVANGDGVLITDGSENPFRLEKHESDAVTNEKGTLIIRVSPTTKRNEARLAGFYFRMTEDREMEFPSVSKSTTYYVCITYDPRKFKEEPLKLERYTDSIPTENNRQHILLHTVEREPNQLLSQARITMYRQYVSPTITVVSESRLPEPTDVLYGTLGIVRSDTSGGSVVPGTGSIFESRGIHGWHNLLVGEWKPLAISSGADHISNGFARWFLGGIQIIARVSLSDRVSSNTIFSLPSGMGVARDFRQIVWTTNKETNAKFEIWADEYNGERARIRGSTAGWVEINTYIPDHYIQ